MPADRERAEAGLVEAVRAHQAADDAMDKLTSLVDRANAGRLVANAHAVEVLARVTETKGEMFAALAAYDRAAAAPPLGHREATLPFDLDEADIIRGACGATLRDVSFAGLADGRLHIHAATRIGAAVLEVLAASVEADGAPAPPSTPAGEPAAATFPRAPADAIEREACDRYERLRGPYSCSDRRHFCADKRDGLYCTRAPKHADGDHVAAGDHGDHRVWVHGRWSPPAGEAR